MCNSVNNTYKKHLPVYIYKHSSLIEPVEITALQIIIIIDPSEIHSPRLNILIYIQFKKNQRRDTYSETHNKETNLNFIKQVRNQL